MTIFARAPVRIDFAGGWTDVDRFAQACGGFVTNAAINLYTHGEFLLGHNRIRLNAEDVGEHVSLPGPADIKYDGVLDLHKAALNMLPVTGGIEILTRSDAPAGSGLGASGALDVTLVAGLARCRHEEFDREDLADLGYQLEAVELGLLGGRQDQYAAAFGGFHEFHFDGTTVQSRPLVVGPELETEFAKHLTLLYTGQSHFSSKTHERVWAAYERGESSVCEALLRIRDLGREAARAIESTDWQCLAEVVDENWVQQQRLDVTISTPRVRQIERAVRDAGAWGVKATGAGAGGCLLVVSPPDQRPHVMKSAELAGARVLAFAFDMEGVTVREEEEVEDAGEQ